MTTAMPVIVSEICFAAITAIFTLTMVIVGKFNTKINLRAAALESMISVLILTHALGMMLDGKEGNVSLILYEVLVFIHFAISYCAICEFNAYVWTSLGKSGAQKAKPGILLVYVINTILLVFLVVNLWTGWLYYFDEFHCLHYGPLILVSPATAIWGLAVDWIMVIVHRKALAKGMFIKLSLFVIFPMAGAILESIFQNVPFVNLMLTIDGVLAFVATQQETAHFIRMQQKELYETQVHSLRSQIAPHFVFNCLSTIRYLCKTDPKQASEAIVDLSFYLRGNMDALDHLNCIPFEREVDHTNYYLALEIRRFEEKINVEYDLQVQNFMIPPLTLQPMVENAVKYGISKKEEGGTISISTREMGDMVELKIQDDGVGFDQSKKTKDGRSHLGIANVRKRVQLMCNGTLHVKSEPGVGTVVTILVPQGGK